ncbi:hypothetical protein NMY22_g19843 [Coprinellus aureogranulatus]|nr:hypothetical protein NMY22_g19843 [Coprinellus aureogranulatus]
MPLSLNQSNRDKWLAITVGRKVGVVYGYNEASTYVSGYPHNVSKGFKSKAEALDRFWTMYQKSQVYCDSGEVLGVEGLTNVPRLTWVRIQDAGQNE